MRTLTLLALLGGIAWGQTTTTTAGGTITNARIADCEEQVGLGGRIYTLRQPGYCSTAVVPCVNADGSVVNPTGITPTTAALPKCESTLPWLQTQMQTIIPAPKPEPMDVPAIFGPDKEYRDFPDGQIICGLAETLELGGLIDHCRQKFPTQTCADKSRILLTDESGGKHCIKFPKEEIK